MADSGVTGLLREYDPGGFYCELLGKAGRPAACARPILDRLCRLDIDDLKARAKDAEMELYGFGITFTVYTQKDAIDGILPFDVIPRVISAEDWQVIESGVAQRGAALNQFLWDVDHEQKILKDGVIPAEPVLNNANYRPEMRELEVPSGTYAHINGTDLVGGAAPAAAEARGSGLATLRWRSGQAIGRDRGRSAS